MSLGSTPLYALLYRSIADAELTASEVLVLFARAKRHNRQKDITGLLLYTGTPSVSGEASGRSRQVDQFVQWLEGPKDAVRALFESICRDPRHCDCEVMAEGPLQVLVGHEERLFPDWSMRLEHVSTLPISVAGIQRFADQFARSKDPEEAPPH